MLSGIIDEGAGAIIRPPRAVYNPSIIPNAVKLPNYGEVQRRHVSFKNSRGLNIVGSYWAPSEEAEKRSCVLYLHGNASCQTEGVYLLPLFIPAGISMLCIDLSGSGNSGGEYISLGHFERCDVKDAVVYARENLGVDKVALWGRSMGAGTAFLALAEDPSISCAVVDSPYTSLTRLVRELAGSFGVPGCLTGLAMRLLRRRVREKAGFDISDVKPVEAATHAVAPIFIIHGANDSFIDCDHARMLFDAYAGDDKELEIVPGIDHGDERPLELTLKAASFIGRVLEVEIRVDEIRELVNSEEHHYHDVEEMLQDE